MDGDLICNFRKCRKNLTDIAWVASCSHIFCDEDGTREFNKSCSCPACNTTLSGKFDIIRIDLQPSEQYKSMVLAGQKPETILEICSRAMAFWTYQAHQERTYQEFVATKARERIVQLEQYYEDIITRTQTELNSLKTQLTGGRKELELLKKQFNEVSEKLVDKNRQYHKLQAMYDSLKRKSITPASFETDPRATPSGRRLHSFDIPIVTGEDLLRGGGGGDATSRNHGNRVLSPAERDFVLKPNSTPIISAASDPSLANVQSMFSMTFNTPSGKSRNRPRP